MSGGSAPGNGRPRGWKNSDNRAIAGQAIGILCLRDTQALLPGNVQNATTFNFPVRYAVLENVSFKQIGNGDPAVEPVIVKAARSLEREGVRAIAGACGSFANYQSSVADAVSVPVFTSILLQVPLLLSSLGNQDKLAIVFASRAVFSTAMRQQCKIDDTSRIVEIDLVGSQPFNDMFEPGAEFDGDALLEDLTNRIESRIDDSVKAILLQCSDLPPFAAELQDHFKLPVFDMTGLINWLHESVVRREFGGYA